MSYGGNNHDSATAKLRLCFTHKPQRWLVISFLLVFLIAGFFLVKSTRGVRATRWMDIYDPADFPDLDSLIQHLQGLRVPIPPVISTAEIVNHMVAGNSYFVTRTLYRVALLLSFLIAIKISSSHVCKLAASFALSIVFLWSTAIIHRGNAQMYDIFYPLFILLYVLFLKYTRSSRSNKRCYLFALASGFFISMAELTRPFVFFMLPVVLFCTYLALRDLSKKYFYIFLIPVVLLTGVWHVHLAVQHKQIAWTNHSGFNLARAWPMVKQPPLLPEVNNQPIKEGRRPNINTAEHYENSKKLQGAVFNFVLKNPFYAARHIFQRSITLLFEVRTSIYKHRPEHRIFYLYKPMVWLSSIWLLIVGCFFVINLVKSKGRRIIFLGIPENILVIIAFLSIVILAIGESEAERARFLISLLPFLAAMLTSQSASAESRQHSLDIMHERLSILS